uniref:Uncharacterized protein n=1 Tax=Setaria italica TaxID=4555 RepID=K3ZPU4_SETIT
MPQRTKRGFFGHPEDRASPFNFLPFEGCKVHRLSISFCWRYVNTPKTRIITEQSKANIEKYITT